MLALAHYTNQHPEHLGARPVIDDDRVHLAIGGHQAYVLLLLVEALQRNLIIDHGNDTGAVIRSLLLADDDVVAVLNVIVDHGLAANLQGKVVVPGEEIVEVQAVIIKGRRFDRSTCCDSAQEWHTVPRRTRLMIGQHYGSGAE